MEFVNDTPVNSLHRAAYYGHKDAVELLYLKGANIEAEDDNQWTPLHIAAFNGHKDVVELLLFIGANIEAKINYQ